MGFVEDIFSPASGLADLSGGSNAVFGTKPKVAPFTPVSLDEATKTTLGINEGNFGDIIKYLNQVVPGFSDLLQSGSDASKELLTQGETLASGQIPSDVMSSVERSSAFQSLQGGFSGSPMGRALSARDLGLTSLNLINQGAGLIGQGSNAAQLWTQLAEGAVSSFVTSTSQEAAVEAANNAGKQATDQYQFNVNAAPDPAALGKFNTNVAIGQQLVGVAGGILGGGSGGAGHSAAPVGSTNWQYNPTTGSFSQAQAQPASSVGSGWSDARLKKILKFVGKTAMGLKVYLFRYRNSPTIFQGLVAQQVQRVVPEAVHEHDGFLRVRYELLDVRPRIVALGGF